MRKKLIGMIFLLIALSFITFGILANQMGLVDVYLNKMIAIP